MTDLGYMIWFLGMAAFTTTVLAVGTMAAAGILPRRTRSVASEGARPRDHEHERGQGAATRREDFTWTS